MIEQPSKPWAVVVAENKAKLDYILTSSQSLQKFYHKLREQTSVYLEMQGNVDPAFSTDALHMSDKLLAAWLVSASSQALIELGLEWRISFCATCYEKNELSPYHVDLVKA